MELMPGRDPHHPTPPDHTTPPCPTLFHPADAEGFLLMELMPGGDLGANLNRKLRDGSARLFGWHQRGRRTALQVAAGLAHLHKHRICHLDIKSRQGLGVKGLGCRGCGKGL